MTRRFTFTDIRAYETPEHVARAASRKATCYVEGSPDVSRLGLLAGRRLLPFVEFILPSDEFEGIGDGHHGVIDALAERKRRMPTAPCFGICDGDALFSLGEGRLLLETRRSFIELDRGRFAADIVFLGFHELENIAFCKTDAVGHALHFARNAKVTDANTETGAEIRALIQSDAANLFEEAMRSFARDKVHCDLGPKRRRGPPLSDEELASLVDGERLGLIDRLRAAENGEGHPFGATPISEHQILRLCHGKELMNRLCDATNPGTSFLDMLFVGLRSEKFGREFQKLLRQKVGLALGHDLPIRV